MRFHRPGGREDLINPVINEGGEVFGINFDINSGPVEAIGGIVEDVKGKAKEVIGTFFGRGDLISEGKAQQDKAKAQRDVAKKEAGAEKARAEAKVQEARQKAAQS
jgi:uncharacterized protein YjbJ (UPF0337 family)